MKRQISRLFSRPQHDLLLVVIGFGCAWGSMTLGVLSGVLLFIGQSLLGVSSDWAWILLTFLIPLIGMIAIGFWVSFKALRAGWLLGVIPAIALAAVFGAFGPHIRTNWKALGLLVGFLVLPSLLGSIAGYLWSKRRAKNGVPDTA